MPLPRLQLFELEDLAWFPPTIRDLATDYLQFMATRFALHKPMAPVLREALTTSGATHIVDLCSGGGGPVLALYECLRVPFTLTDKYPNLPAFRRLSELHPEGILYVAEACEADAVPRNLLGLRTMFNAFHHFAPARARSVLECAVEARQPIAIFEIPERSLVMIAWIFITPLFVALATPFIRPFQWRRLLWTYLVPLFPLTCWWDGLVSQLRAYTAPEMLELTRGLIGYEWEVGCLNLDPTAHLTYLVGIPSTAAGHEKR
jgi:hypothetical protein